MGAEGGWAREGGEMDARVLAQEVGAGWEREELGVAAREVAGGRARAAAVGLVREVAVGRAREN